MAEVEWIKVSTSMFETSRKIKQIELMKDGDRILVIWFKLLLLAGNVNDGGAIYITEDKPYDLESLAGELRRPVALVKQAIDVFEGYGMIENDGGIIYLTSWEKYQSAEKLEALREYNREAQRKSRAKKKQKSVNDTVNDTSMTNQANVTGCQDTEEEEELDKEFHSFTLSDTRAGACAGEDDDVENSVENSVENLKRDALMRRYLGGTLGGGVVLMSEEQLSSLCEILSHEELERYLTVVRDCEMQGKHYKKSHYQAILDMAQKDRRIK